MGPISKRNIAASKKVNKMFRERDINFCEVCGTDQYLTISHRHKRLWYRSRPHLLYDFNQVLRLCLRCHDKIEYNRDASEWLFIKLRGEEKL